jgi:Ca-activated chloride channel homolog
MQSKYQPFRKSFANRNRKLVHARRGSMLLLASLTFTVVVALAGLCINIAYIELVRTEQRLATDAASKAALVVLGQTQSTSQARQAAKDIAALHRVGGKPVVLADADIQIGSSTRLSDGTFSFTTTAGSNTVTNSVRINSNLNRLAGGGVNTLLPQVLGTGTFSSEQSATSTRIEMDVCLVVDRSGSMSWTLGATPFTYPNQKPEDSPLLLYFQLPHATLSRWATLTNSVNIFATVLNDAPIKTRVALASYASNFTFGVWTSKVASVDQTLTTDYTTLKTKLNALATQPLIGNTNISAGLREGVNALTDPATSRLTSCKCIVLLTDGVMTQGDDPVELATLAREMNIRVHTIAFSAQADVQLMRRVAQAGGGQAYIAPDAASLETAFRTIAATLPNMLTQ